MKRFFLSIKEGLADLKYVINDGKYKLLARPFLAAVILCFGVYYYTRMGQKEVAKARTEIAALQAQKTKLAGYKASKARVLELEKYFPNVADKNEWLVTQIIETFDNNNLHYNFTGSQSEDSTANLIVTSMGVSFKADFASAVKLIMNFENFKKFIKIQELAFAKDDKDFGTEQFTMKISTAFPKELIGGKKTGAANEQK